jgi:hypothetical protein
MITIQYTLSKDDYVSYFTYIYWDEKGRKRKRLKNLFKQLFFLLLFTLVMFYTGSFRSNLKFVVPILLLIFGTSTISFISGKSDLESQAKSIADNPENESLFLETFLNISDSELQIKNKLIASTYQWSAFVNKIETDTYYFLFENSLQAIVIPKRAFKNNDEKMAFDKILSRNLSLEAELKDALH